MRHIYWINLPRFFPSNSNFVFYMSMGVIVGIWTIKIEPNTSYTILRKENRIPRSIANTLSAFPKPFRNSLF